MLTIKYIETEDEYQSARAIREDVFIIGQNVLDLTHAKFLLMTLRKFMG